MCVQCNSSGCSSCGALTVPIGLTGPTGATGAAGAKGTNGATGAAGPTWMSWSFSVGSDTPWILGGSAAGTPKIAAYIHYPGYNTIAIPTYVKVVTDGLEAVNDYNVELYDVTNSQILAFKNNITNVPITLDALTVNTNNWPAGSAILVIRIQDNQLANNRVSLESMTWHN